MSEIDHYLNAVLEQGGAEAAADGAASVEAHHLLLAISAHEGNTAHESAPCPAPSPWPASTGPLWSSA
ncbi:hypothetical protein [Nonomuraea jiangxiensis]|uniref:Clp amino terminal domain-containing protein, pathogenicity island component n=1 Tax=Nonomuraea jiangxiensis TaxID=633440 RepID=A0A1G8EYR7_9ACTN|nr:hypothetical protein [Nonomuraea jiangxiensis]SDH74984.1 hypothetical protein SAMN05421869_103145 [Nonomuraea jiangxiensis]